MKAQLGADEVVDYTTSDFAEAYASPDKQFDIVLDCMVCLRRSRRPCSTLCWQHCTSPW